MSHAPARMFHAVVVLGAALTACDRAGGSGPAQEPRTDAHGGDGDRVPIDRAPGTEATQAAPPKAAPPTAAPPTAAPPEEQPSDAGTEPDAQAPPGKVRRMRGGAVIPADSPCRDGSERMYPPCFFIR